jgi:hypothetical protein
VANALLWREAKVNLTTIPGARSDVAGA